MNQKSRTTAILLAFFLGCWGVHKFYLGDKKKGLIYLVIGIIGCFTIVPLIVVGIFALIDFVKLIMMSDTEFIQKYCSKSDSIIASSPSGASNNQSQSALIENEDIHDVTFCTECGAKIIKRAKFCPICGAAQ